MKRQRSPSKSTLLVLSKLSMVPQYGYALMKETDLKSGTLYPILMRLTDRGYLTAKWEEPQSPGRPPRQRYQLTPKGRAYVKETLEQQTALETLRGVKS